MFRDREAAGRALARRLVDSPYAKEDPVVVCIPKGSLPLGRIIAEELDCDLDICLVRRIVSQTDPDNSIAAVAENGDIHLSDRSSWDMSRKYIEDMRMKELNDIRQRRLLYNTPAIPLKRRTVILVDDGVATGATMLAAIHALRKENPAKIVVATPVASIEAVQKITKKKITELITLFIPPTFMVLAQFYVDFTPVTDIEVMECLRDNRSKIRRRVSRALSETPSEISECSDRSSNSDTEEKEDNDDSVVLPFPKDEHWIGMLPVLVIASRRKVEQQEQVLAVVEQQQQQLQEDQGIIPALNVAVT